MGKGKKERRGNESKMDWGQSGVNTNSALQLQEEREEKLLKKISRSIILPPP